MTKVAYRIDGSQAAAVTVDAHDSVSQSDEATISLKGLMQKDYSSNLARKKQLQSANRNFAPSGGEASGPAPKTLDKDSQSFGEYLFGSTYSDPALAAGGYGAPPPNWTSKTSSRVMVRLGTRGLMGAGLYSMANRWIPGKLHGYSAEGAFDRSNPVQHLARFFDTIYGKPIQAYVSQYYKMAGRSAEEAASLAKEATTFRVKRFFGRDEPGRSLGAEIVGMTGDFAAGSIGDASGRRIANMLDPNIRNPWEDEQDGHIHWDLFAKEMGKSAWQIFSKNQGEDWAAALPYVYQMRFQRQSINRLYRGFKTSSDHQFNGGSWRVNEQGELISSFAKAGALDLQLRFTGYNWYTLMYRDLYDNIAERIKLFRDTGELNSPFTATGQEGVLDNAAHAFRYVAKSAVKAFIYMTPAVPFFWVTRTPQTKAHGQLIVVDSNTGSVAQNLKERPFGPFAKENTRGVFDRLLNPFGKACYRTSKALNQGLSALGVPKEHTTMRYTHPTFAETFVNSSASYTPYMIMKTETALRWDRPKGADGLNGMDRGAYRLIDGFARFNLGEIAAGFSDIRNEITNPPSTRTIQQRRAANEAAYQRAKEAETQEDETAQDASKEAANINAKPKTTVSDVSEEAGQEAAYNAMDEAALAADASWKHRAMREEFMKTPYPEPGTTIH